jgi:arylsulfatase A-like enzyme
MLINWPGVIQQGSIYSKPAITFDISATALAAAGANTDQIDGVDLVPFVTGKMHGSPHEILFWRSRTMSNNYGARYGDWKYVHSTEGDAVPGPKQTPAREMLFNLANDISEQHDLSADEPARLADLRKRYEKWSNEVDADCKGMGLAPKFGPTSQPGKGVSPSSQ